LVVGSFFLSLEVGTHDTVRKKKKKKKEEGNRGSSSSFSFHQILFFDEWERSGA